MSTTTSAHYPNALDANTLREMYKELKDNRGLKSAIVAYLVHKVERNEASHVTEFMNNVAPDEAFIVRFFRKMDKLHPRRFSQYVRSQYDCLANTTMMN